MSDYTYTDKKGHHIGVYSQPKRSRIVLGQNGGNQNVDLAMEDAPEFALAVLKAAGYGGKGEYVLANAINSAVACIESHIENVERNAKAKALTKRRDELARELFSCSWRTVGEIGEDSPMGRAIDRIIELESAS